MAHAAEVEIATSQRWLRDWSVTNELEWEEERKHIARELHDELGQVLPALRMNHLGDGNAVLRDGSSVE